MDQIFSVSLKLSQKLNLLLNGLKKAQWFLLKEELHCQNGKLLMAKQLKDI